MTHEIRGVDAEKYAYSVNKLRQKVGLETWIWRQTVTSQTAHTKHKWPPYATEWKPLWKLCAYATTLAAVILSLLQENNLSNSIPHRVKCRTEAVKHLSRSIETWKMLKIILSKLKLINEQNQWYHTKLCFNINMAMCGLPSNMKNSSHKTSQTSLLFLKALHIQNLKRRKWGGIAYFVPSVWKSGGHFPRVPQQIVPMVSNERGLKWMWSQMNVVSNEWSH